MGPTTLYGHTERGRRSNRKVCLLFNRRRVHKGENYIWQGWEVPNAENSACPLRSRRKSTAHHYKISNDQGNPEWLLGGVPDTPPDEAPTLERHRGSAQEMRVETFLLVFAAIFPVVNPPGAALIFLGLTQGASSQTRRWLARRVAVNAFVIINLSLTVGALVLKIYGISIPVLRVAGGLIVAVAGWKLLNEENSKAADETASKERTTDFTDLAFYPLTMPLTTGPGTIAVMISVGLSRSAYSDGRILPFLVAVLLATMVIALMIYICFAYSDRVPRLLGAVGYGHSRPAHCLYLVLPRRADHLDRRQRTSLGTVTLQRATMAMPLVTTEELFRQL